MVILLIKFIKKAPRKRGFLLCSWIAYMEKIMQKEIIHNQGIIAN
jgi:hypothetical protein